MNDKKLELLAFQSKDDCSAIYPVSGEIRMQFSTDKPVYLQIGDSCYRLDKPISLKVKYFSKARIIINKEMLNC